MQNVYETEKQRVFQGGDLIKFNYCPGAEWRFCRNRVIIDTLVPWNS